jgi:hypothetical protein
MDKKQKRILLIAGIAEVIIVAFCLTVSIMVMVKTDPNAKLTPEQIIAKHGAFIGGLMNNPTLFLVTIVLPLFVILALDVIYLIMYATKRESALSDKERDAIEAAAKEEARLEVLREMEEEAKAEKK